MSETRSAHAETKKALRLALSGFYPEQALRQWFDPLRVVCDSPDRRLIVTWPHHLFGAWVSVESIDRLRQIVSGLYGDAWILDCRNPCVIGMRDQEQSPPALHAGPFRNPEGDPPCSGKPDLPANCAYTLENYLVNAKNTFPLTVLQETASGKLTCNPLVLYGDSGSGKTHLTRALGNALTARFAKHSIVCGSADDLADLLASFGERETLRRLSSCQALIVDDIQRLANLPALSEIMPAIVDHCLEHGKPFVATTCLPPSAWKEFPRRVGSRLEQGLVMILHLPDMDIRLRYAQQQNRILGLNLGRSQLLVLAQQCVGFRRLIGVIQRLNTLKNLFGQDVSAQDMDHALMRTADAPVASPQQIINLVAARRNVRPEDIMGAKRHPHIVRTRQIAMFLCRTILHSSYPAIGQLFGGRDHSTVIHSIKKIQLLWETDKDMHTTLTELSLACQQKIT